VSDVGGDSVDLDLKGEEKEEERVEFFSGFWKEILGITHKGVKRARSGRCVHLIPASGDRERSVVEQESNKGLGSVC